jgi:release factor glutamine methyltransferase
MMNRVAKSSLYGTFKRLTRDNLSKSGARGYKNRKSGPNFVSRLWPVGQRLSHCNYANATQAIDLSTMPPKVEDLLRFVASHLKGVKSCSEPRLEASLLIGIALNEAREAVIMNYKRELGQKELQKVKEVIEKRKKEMPIALLAGKKNFFGSDFIVTSDTLIPRPATETLVDQTLHLTQTHFTAHPNAQDDDFNSSLRLLELGVGTGCVIISLLKEFNKLLKNRDVSYRVTGVGVDVNPKSLKVAAQNAERLGIQSDQLTYYESNWTQELVEKHKVTDKFDILVSNPPYLTNDDWEVAPYVMRFYEPSIAFLGGQDGLDCYKTIYKQSERILNPGALVCFEIGAWQADGVKTIFTSEQRFQFLSTVQDMDGHDRVISFLYQGTHPWRRNKPHL